jgi:predicted DNA-binding transcriptional regulator YafY
MSAKTARWLDLVAFLLQHRFPVTREEIFERVRSYGGAGERGGGESRRRKFERDKDELRALGVEIETVPLPAATGDAPQAGYRLAAAGLYLPYLELEEASSSGTTAPVNRRLYHRLQRVVLDRGEVAILDRATRRLAERTELPLSSAALSARRKLAFDLPLSAAAVERVLAAPISEPGRQALGVLQDAVATRTAVWCRYYAIGRDAEEDREIEPYALYFQRSHWYCVARARDRNALRVFRVDRMRDARRLRGAAAAFEIPSDFDVRPYLDRAPWEMSDAPAVTVHVRFRFPESRWVLNDGLGTPVEPLLDDGGAEIAFQVRERELFLRWLLTFQRQAEVLEPEEVRRELEQLRERVAELYAERYRGADSGVE